jgi:hypothetical protein
MWVYSNTFSGLVNSSVTKIYENIVKQAACSSSFMSFRNISILTLCSAEPWISSGVFQGLPQAQFLYNKTEKKKEKKTSIAFFISPQIYVGLE